MASSSKSDGSRPAALNLDRLYCPITGELFRDPVMTPNGHSYEREAITEWLSSHSESPLTRLPLQDSDLRPNLALRDLVEDAKKQQAASLPDKIDPKVDLGALPPAGQLPQLSVARLGEQTLITIQPPFTGSGPQFAEPSDPLPCNVVLVLDVSGSMGSPVVLKTADGGSECHGLDILDLVKHSSRTIIANLRDQDRLAIVKYSTDASIVLPLTSMNAAGRKRATALVEGLHDESMTNLWGGLEQGLSLLKDVCGTAANNSVMLLTDGLPNINPPSGIVPSLVKYLDAGHFDGTIFTFGFGYDLDSDLLRQIAELGHGSFAFIPDGGFVGTVFISALAAIMSFVTRKITVSVEADAQTQILDNALEDSAVHKTSWGFAARLAPLMAGQPQTLVLEGPPPTSVTLEFDPFTSSSKLEKVSIPLDQYVVVGDAAPGAVQPAAPSALAGYEAAARLSTVAKLRKITALDDAAVSSAGRLAMEAIAAVEASKAASSQEGEGSASDAPAASYLADLLTDLTGQVTEAVSKRDWFKRWGRHYLRSLEHAHLRQQCNNFKDPGVQHYGGKLFFHLREQFEATFLTLPAPTPSLAGYGSKPVAMKSYYNPRGVCFAGDSRLSLATASGSFAPTAMCEVRKGDVVRTAQGIARVVCIVKTEMKTPSGLVELSQIGDLWLTPWHPVVFPADVATGKWSFPAVRVGSCLRKCDAVYNLVLDRHHSVLVEGVQCITLAHGIEGDSVASHEYFGSQRVIEDLKAFPGWKDGLVTVQSHQIETEASSAEGASDSLALEPRVVGLLVR